MNRNLFKTTLCLMSLALLNACAESTDSVDITGTLDLGEFSVVSGESTLTVGDDSISGTGTLVFSEPVTDEEFNHELTFTLDQDDASLTWVTFSDSDLADGIETRFTRQGTAVGATLLVDNAQETSSITISGDASSELNYAIESHNSEEPAHMLIFPGDLAGALLGEDALFNSEDDAPAPGKGTGGKFFGVRLNNATLTRVVGAEARFSD